MAQADLYTDEDDIVRPCANAGEGCPWPAMMRQKVCRACFNNVMTPELDSYRARLYAAQIERTRVERERAAAELAKAQMKRQRTAEKRAATRRLKEIEKMRRKLAELEAEDAQRVTPSMLTANDRGIEL